MAAILDTILDLEEFLGIPGGKTRGVFTSDSTHVPAPIPEKISLLQKTCPG